MKVVVMSNFDLPIARTPMADRTRGIATCHRRPFEISICHIQVAFEAVTPAKLERILDPEILEKL